MFKNTEKIIKSNENLREKVNSISLSTIMNRESSPKKQLFVEFSPFSAKIKKFEKKNSDIINTIKKKNKKSKSDILQNLCNFSKKSKEINILNYLEELNKKCDKIEFDLEKNENNIKNFDQNKKDSIDFNEKSMRLEQKISYIEGKYTKIENYLDNLTNNFTKKSDVKEDWVKK